MTETNISTARVPQVTVIDPRIPEKAKLRVAAYARVSSDSEDQVNSYIAQVDFYSKHIAGKEDWEMVDIYADEGISGLDDFAMIGGAAIGKVRFLRQGCHVWHQGFSLPQTFQPCVEAEREARQGYR